MPREASKRIDFKHDSVDVYDVDSKRNPSKKEELEAHYLRDMGTSPEAMGVAMGMTPAMVRKLEAMSYEEAADYLAGLRVDGLLDAEPFHQVSADWEQVAAWQGAMMTTGAKKLEEDDKQQEVITLGLDTWKKIEAGKPVTLPRPFDGPGTNTMATMEAHTLMSWAWRAKKADSTRGIPALIGNLSPVAGDATPSVTSSGKWRERGTSMRVEVGFSSFASIEANELEPIVKTTKKDLGKKQAEHVWVAFTSTVTPQGERDKAELQASKRGELIASKKAPMAIEARVTYAQRLEAKKLAKLEAKKLAKVSA